MIPSGREAGGDTEQVSGSKWGPQMGTTNDYISLYSFMKFSKGRKNLRGINLLKEEGIVALREIHVQVPGRVANSGHGQSTLACSETHSSQLGWL